ncbi:MAG: hypothetical protein JSS14_21770 [Proteobacteria bacterium]|nr:hypothetical protein [Pseudomonadota bacterium]
MNLDDYPLPLPYEDYWLVTVAGTSAGNKWSVVLWPDPYRSFTSAPASSATTIAGLGRIEALALAQALRARIRPIRRLMGRTTRDLDAANL